MHNCAFPSNCLLFLKWEIAFLEQFEDAAREVADEVTRPRPLGEEEVQDIQIMLRSEANPMQIRKLRVGSWSQPLRCNDVWVDHRFPNRPKSWVNKAVIKEGRQGGGEGRGGGGGGGELMKVQLSSSLIQMKTMEEVRLPPELHISQPLE